MSELLTTDLVFATPKEARQIRQKLLADIRPLITSVALNSCVNVCPPPNFNRARKGHVIEGRNARFIREFAEDRIVANWGVAAITIPSALSESWSRLLDQ